VPGRPAVAELVAAPDALPFHGSAVPGTILVPRSEPIKGESLIGSIRTAD
jgi:hypothetical protein